MANDPKYRFGTDDQVFHRGGSYYLPEEEPVVLFRGKDVGTLVALEAYRDFMIYVAEHADNDHARDVARAHAESITERIRTIKAYQQAHPERTGLGCSPGSWHPAMLGRFPVPD